MNEGVHIRHLTKNEKFVRFKRMNSYVVPAKVKHQIVHNQRQDDVGIAVSKNGRTDFRKYDASKVYWYTEPYAYVTHVPMKSQGVTVDLSHLV